MDKLKLIQILKSYPTSHMDISENSSLVIDLHKEMVRARIDEREHMVFIDNQGREDYEPFVSYRSTIDGLLMNWSDRTRQLEKDLGEPYESS